MTVIQTTLLGGPEEPEAPPSLARLLAENPRVREVVRRIGLFAPNHKPFPVETLRDLAEDPEPPSDEELRAMSPWLRGAMCIIFGLPGEPVAPRPPRAEEPVLSMVHRRCGDWTPRGSASAPCPEASP